MPSTVESFATSTESGLTSILKLSSYPEPPFIMFTLLICPRLLISKSKSNPLPFPNNSKLGPCLIVEVVASYVGSRYPLPVSIILMSVTTPP